MRRIRPALMRISSGRGRLRRRLGHAETERMREWVRMRVRRRVVRGYVVMRRANAATGVTPETTDVCASQ